MDVNEIYQLVQYACAKNSGQGYITPDDFNITIKVAARGYTDYLLGQTQKYQQGRPIPVVQFGENERVKTSLIPLIYEKILSVNSTTGIAQYPDDFEQVDAMFSLYGFYNIKYTQQDKLNSRYQSVVSPIGRNPVYLIGHEGFQFFPPDLGNARMIYIRTPPDMIWGYDEVNGLPVYNPIKSTQPVWADTDILNIVVRALNIIGINLQLGVVIQYSQQIKQGGQ